jgi:Ca-activated chloride channel homolog
MFSAVFRDILVCLCFCACARAQTVTVFSLTFQGNTSINDSRLKSQLRMIREGGPYQPDVMAFEIQNLTRFYRDEGYLQAEAGPPQVTFQEVPGRGKAASIRLPISEGPLFTLGELSVRNTELFDSATLLQMCPVRKGQPYSRRRMQEWQEKIGEGYSEMGYIRFSARLVEKIQDSRHTVDGILECEEGGAYTVGKIIVDGIPVPEQAAFKKKLLLHEGGVYNPEMIGTSVYYINQMGTYRPISGSDIELKIDDSKNTVDVVLRVVPLKKSSSLRVRIPAAGKLAAGFAESRIPAQDSQATIRSEVALVNVIFSVLDRNNRIIPGLVADDFLVFEDRQPQKIEFFGEIGKGSEVPLTIALLIDTSGSVKTKLNFEVETASEFFKGVLRKNKDLALIIQFDSDVNLVQDFTDDLSKLNQALESLTAGNSTSLYDAIYLAVEDKLKIETGRKVIVAITDGEDTASKLKKEIAIEAAQKSDVLIYGIGVRGDFGVNFGVLKKFAEETGGLFFSPHSKLSEIQEAFRAIGEDLKSQYSLAYSSTNPKKDGTFRSIEIRPRQPGLRIRARKGYYAPRGGK